MFRLLIMVCTFLSMHTHMFAEGNQSFFPKKKISIENLTTRTFYGATYYLAKKRATQADEPFRIEPNSTQEIVLPVGKPLTSRILCVHDIPENIRPIIDNPKQNLSVPVLLADIGIGHPHSFIIVTTQDGETYLRPRNLHQAEEEMKSLRNSIEETSAHMQNMATAQTYQNTIDEQEALFLEKRAPFITETVKHFAEIEGPMIHTPRIGLCFSGGGCRAMLTSLGVLKGLEELKLLNAIQYMTGVSGGTWAIAQWLLHKKTPSETIELLKKALPKAPKLAKALIAAIPEVRRIHQTKSLFGLKAAIPDLFSVCLGHMFFRPLQINYQQTSLSKLAGNLHPAQYPFPLCTAVSPHPEHEKQYDWIEFSPYLVRHAATEVGIPTWAFMRQFNNNHSTNAMPEPPLSYYMAIWGSAFSVSLHDIIFTGKPFLQKLIPNFLLQNIEHDKWGKEKFSPALIPNFSLNSTPESKYTIPKYIQMIDSTHGSPIAVHPLLHASREQDIIILVNAGTSARLDIPWLYNMRRDIRKRYPNFPFDIDAALGNPFTVWRSENRDEPIIVHISLHKDDSFDPGYDPRTNRTNKTINFTYPAQAIDQLTGLSAHIIKQHIQELKEIILEKTMVQDTAIDDEASFLQTLWHKLF